MAERAVRARDLSGVVHVADDLKTRPDITSAADRAICALGIAAGVAGARDVQDGLLVGAGPSCGPH